MDIEKLREHCLAVPGAEESFPFTLLSARDILVFKVMGKMFAFINLSPKDGVFRVSMKADPQRSLRLREEYAGIYNEAHDSGLNWNMIELESDVPDELIADLVRHSADQVIGKLPRARREEYFKMFPGQE